MKSYSVMVDVWREGIISNIVWGKNTSKSYLVIPIVDELCQNPGLNTEKDLAAFASLLCTILLKAFKAGYAEVNMGLAIACTFYLQIIDSNFFSFPKYFPVAGLHVI